MDNLTRRILSALVAAPVAIAAVWFGFPWFELLVAAILLGGAFEWTGLCRLGWRAGAAVWLTPLVTVLVAAFAGPPNALAVLMIGTGIGFMQVSTPVSLAEPKRSAGRWTAGGAALLGIAGLSAIYLRVWVPDGAATILWLLAVVWATDIGAFFTGRAIGGAKLMPSVSPGKTWSGFVGGIVLAMLTGLAAAFLKTSALSVPALAVAFAVALAAVAGDLLESWVKRRFGAKDSGTVMPGHGGILDRIDGLLTATPVLAIIAALSAGDPITWQ